MAFRIPHFWEPEEALGSAWHDMTRGWGVEPSHEQARVAYADLATRIGVMHRAAGAAQGAEITPSAASVSKARLVGRDAFAHEVLHVTRATMDGRKLALPASIALFPERELNRDLYLWLAAVCAFVETPFTPPDGALAADLAALRAIHRAEKRMLASLPGLAGRRAALARALLAIRPTPRLPAVEAELEATIRALLGDGEGRGRFYEAIVGEAFEPAAFPTPEDYRTFRPLALWPALAAQAASEAGSTQDDPGASGPPPGEEARKTLRARRRRSDEANRKDSLILHRFETILSWAEFLNLNRKVEDDEEDSARKAAQDLDEVSVASEMRTARKKLLFDLDLAPRDIDADRLVGEATYPEWDWRRGVYLPDHVKVQERLAQEQDANVFDHPRARRRIARVRRQFEALRPRRRIVRRQIDGFDLDFDEVVRARCDLLACGEASDRLYSAIRDDERDLSVCVLIDVSRSTESAVTGRPVIEIAREALAALVGGVTACGDRVAVYAFSSLRRERVMVEKVKDFDEPDDETFRRRVMGLTPRFYTRMGAAIRHVSKHLAAQGARRRLLLVLTDGKPNDLDHYEGRHGVEDTRRAVQEARQNGQAVFAITIDARAKDYIPHLFGVSGFAIVPHAERLIEALPDLYRHVAG